MNSNHLTAEMVDNNFFEIVEFWEVPYLKEGDVILKKTYENKEKGMFLQGEMNMIK